MADANVLNRFETPNSGNDNPLILDGTVETGNGQSLKTKLMTVLVEDISTTVTDYLAPGIAGTIVKITGVLSQSIDVTTAVTFKINGITITGSGLTFADTAPAGNVETSSPTALNVITAGQRIESASVGQTNTAASVHVTIEILPS